MVYVETVAGKDVPSDMMGRLEALVDSITALKTAEREIKNKIDIKRGEFDMIVGNYEVSLIETESSTASISNSERFSKWSDVEKVFENIPRRMQTIKTLTPDIKKIRKLVESGKLPTEILDLATMTIVNRVTFKANQPEE